jgi:PBP1b-binding outer membrane lipoprotein LpoB
MKIYSLVACIALVLSGCNESSSSDPTQTVEWYKENTDARQAMMQKCANNPGELRTTPNCINAKQAEQAVLMDKLPPGFRPKNQ